MEHYHVKNSFFRNGIDYWHFVTIQFQSELDLIESAKMPFEQELNIYLRSYYPYRPGYTRRGKGAGCGESGMRSLLQFVWRSRLHPFYVAKPSWVVIFSARRGILGSENIENATGDNFSTSSEFYILIAFTFSCGYLLVFVKQSVIWTLPERNELLALFSSVTL